MRMLPSHYFPDLYKENYSVENPLLKEKKLSVIISNSGVPEETVLSDVTPYRMVDFTDVSEKLTAPIFRVGAQPFILKIETNGSSEKMVNFHHTTRRHAPENNFHSHLSKNTKHCNE